MLEILSRLKGYYIICAFSKNMFTRIYFYIIIYVKFYIYNLIVFFMFYHRSPYVLVRLTKDQTIMPATFISCYVSFGPKEVKL